MSSNTDKALLLRLNKNMANERAAYIRREQNQTAEVYRDAQATMLETVRRVGKTGDMGLILSAERDILRNDLRFYGNSAGMRGSLKTALQELGHAEAMLPVVNDANLYMAVDASHGNPKSRIGGLPRDAAKQFFTSHNARLLNADKSRLTETEKRIIDARRHNIRVAGLAYTALQEKALGVDLRKRHEREMTM